jgi:hypothetical protein
MFLNVQLIRLGPAMPILVNGDNWSVEEGVGDDGAIRFHRLVRTYYLLDHGTPDIGFVIRFMWTIEDATNLEIKNNFRIFVRPLPLEGGREILLGLHARHQGGTVQVIAVPNVENEAFFLDAELFIEPSGAATCLKALLAGTDLTFSLSMPASSEAGDIAQNPTPPLLTVILPNGPEFKQYYDKIRRQIERGRWITRYRNSLKES